LPIVDFRLPIEILSLPPQFSGMAHTVTDDLQSKIVNRQSSMILPLAATTAPAPASPAAAGMPAATAPTASPASGATSSASPEVIARWTRFIDGQAAALQGLTIKAGDSPLQVLALRQFDESEAPRLSRGLVANDDRRSGMKTCAADELREFVVCHFVRQIPHE
jgi:hypothetical protein